VAQEEILLSRRTGRSLKNMRSRTGSLLIIVMIVMAVAMILISSALMITVAARNHFYKNAELDQTRLTALSVAQTIGNAVSNADIKDEQLIGLADNEVTVDVTSANGYSSTSVSAGNNSIAPGLRNTSDSKTTATFGYYPSKLEPQYVSIVVTSTINTGISSGSSETVTLLLKKKISGISASAFSNQVLIGDPSTHNSFLMFGVGYGQWGTDAPSMVVNGDTSIYQGDPTGSGHAGDIGFSTDLVVVDGRLNLGRTVTDAGIDNDLKVIFKKNVILYGDGATINANSLNVTDFVNIIAFGSENTNSSIFSTGLWPDPPVPSNLTAGAAMNVSGAVYLSYRSLTDASSTDNSKSRLSLPSTSTTAAFVVDNSGALTTSFTPSNSGKYFRAANSAVLNLDGIPVALSTSNAIITNIQTAANSYLTAENDAYYTRQVLSQVDAMNSGIAEYVTPQEVKANCIKLTTTQCTTTASTPAFSGSAYYIDTADNNTRLGTVGSWTDTKVPTVITFDLTDHDITLYILGDDAGSSGDLFTIGSGRFVFINGGANIGRIVLLGGADLTLANNKYYSNPPPGSPPNEPADHQTGILGTALPASTARWSAWPSTVYGYKPFVYIFGMQNNEVVAQDRTILEAYVGMYGNGSLELYYYCYFFGRVEARHLYSNRVDPSGDKGIDFPYCPGPNDLYGNMRLVVRSDYEIAGYVTS